MKQTIIAALITAGFVVLFDAGKDFAVSKIKEAKAKKTTSAAA